MLDQPMLLERGQKLTHLGLELPLADLEFQAELGDRLWAAAPFGQKLPEASTGAVEGEDLVSSHVDEHQLVLDRPRQDVGMRPEGASVDRFAHASPLSHFTPASGGGNM